jgi:uncharacterized protein YqeY
MSLKEEIQKKSLEARKVKDVNAISALNSLKTAIVEAEKSNSNIEVSDNDVIKLITKTAKQRQDSYEAFIKAGNQVKADEELAQKGVVESFLPKQMSDEEITLALQSILDTIGQLPNINATIGKTLGEFNKLYTGKADRERVTSLIKQLIS